MKLSLSVFLHRVSHQFWPHLEIPNSDFNLTRALTSLEWLISPIIWSRLGSPLSTTPAAWLLLKESYLFLSKGVPLPEDNIHFLPAKKKELSNFVLSLCVISSTKIKEEFNSYRLFMGPHSTHIMIVECISPASSI